MSALADDRDDLLERVDLADLFTELLGPRSNGGWPCPNPQHAQTGKTPPVSVKADGPGLWKCHGCDAGGTAIDLVMLATSVDVAGAFAELHRRAGTAPKRRPEPARPRRPDRPVDVEVAERVLCSFLAGRRWAREVAGRFALTAVLDAHGKWRVRFPFRHDGEVVWHQDRIVQGYGPKFLAPSGSRSVLFARDLAASMKAATELGGAVLVEGPPDVIALDCALTAPAVFGVAGVQMPQERWVPAMAGLDVALIADNDEAGEKFRASAGAALEGAGCDVLQVRVPAAHADLDDWRRAHDTDEAFGVSVLAAFDAAGVVR